MPRTKQARKQGLVELVCMDCGKRQSFKASSPAAPKLTASEESAKSGWSYSVGFFSMITGDHNNRCAECTGNLNEH